MSCGSKFDGMTSLNCRRNIFTSASYSLWRALTCFNLIIKQKHEEGIPNHLPFLALNQFTKQFKAESPVDYKA